MKHHVLLVLIVSVYALVANSQVVTILEKDSHNPLELVTIYSEKPEVYATTNANGQADISAFTDSEHIQIRYLGFQSIDLSYQQIKEQEVSYLYGSR